MVFKKYELLLQGPTLFPTIFGHEAAGYVIIRLFFISKFVATLAWHMHIHDMIMFLFCAHVTVQRG